MTRTLNPVLISTLLLVFAAPASAGLEPVSTTSSGAPGDHGSLFPALNADATIVVFRSHASNLDGEERAICSDHPITEVSYCGLLLARVLPHGGYFRIALAHDGGPANGSVGIATMDDEGRFVAFKSRADNLHMNGTDGTEHVYVRDLTTGTTRIVTVDRTGKPITEHEGSNCFWACGGVSLSGNGRWVVFDSWSEALLAGDTNHRPDVFLRDLHEGRTIRVSISTNGDEGNDASWIPGTDGVSDDGGRIVFQSRATNLAGAVPPQCPADPPFPEGTCLQVYVHDRDSRETVRLSARAEGEPEPVIPRHQPSAETDM